jgi:hypothetical protein
MQGKSDELVRKNKILRHKNKGTRPPCRVLVDSSLSSLTHFAFC